MKKLIMLGCLLAIITSGCSGGGGGGVPADNSRLTGDWSYMLMIGGSFATVRGIASFNGDGTATHTEIEKSAGPLQVPDFAFNYTAYTNDRIVFKEFVGTLSNDGNFFVATDTDTSTGPEVMMMIAIKQPTAATDADLNGDYFSGVFFNNNTDAMASDTMVVGRNMNAGAGTYTVIAPPGPSGNFGYTTIADGTTVIDDDGVPAADTGEVGTVSIDGNLFISADTDTTNPDDMIFTAMSIKTSTGKTNADLSGTYVLHQFMDDNVGTGVDWITTISEVTFNGDNVAGIGTGSYTDLASSTGTPDPPNQPFEYGVDTGGDQGGFVLDPAAIGGPDTVGIMSPDASIIGLVKNDGGSAVALMVGVKK